MKYLIYPLFLLSIIIVPALCQNSKPKNEESLLYILATLATDELEKEEAFAQKEQAQVQYVCLWRGCLKKFNQPDIFYNHIKKHAISRQKNQICLWKDCGKTFVNYSGLKRHFPTHTKEKPWVCDNCKKSFCRKNRLQYHLDHKVCS